MEFGSVTKLDKRNKTTSKKFTMTSHRKIQTYGQLGVIQKPVRPKIETGKSTRGNIGNARRNKGNM